MKVAIIGGGSLGLMWCARLMQAGLVPTLIVRTEEQKELIREQGLIYTENGEHKTFYPLVESMVSYLGELPVWTVLIVKQTHISALLPFLQSHINRKGYIYSLQNGLGHYEKLVQVFAPKQIYLGSTSDGALRHQANHVERTGYGEIWVGQPGEPEPPAALFSEVDRLQRHGMIIQWDSQIMMRLWRKVIINSTINPMTAVLQIENGQLLRSDSARSIMKAIFDEGCLVAAALGFQFYEDLWQEIEAVCRNTSRNRSSMLQDVLGSRKTEIEYINGYIVKAGERVGIITPHNQLMLQLIHTIEELQQLDRLNEKEN